MRTSIFSLALIVGSAFTANAQNVNIPDANFKAYLVGNAVINTNSDTEIQVTEASSFTGAINCASHSISDLTGIEAFTSLTQLACYNNLNITAIDVSTIPTLQMLYCSSNNITTLDVSNNPNLTFLACDDNELVSLNVANGNNTSIPGNSFYANSNPNLTCIQVDDVSYSTSTWTQIDPTASFSLNCAACTVNIPDANFKAYLLGSPVINTNGDSEIQCAEAAAYDNTLICSSLNIADLTGIEAFTSMTALWCSDNPLVTLDVSNCTALTSLTCGQCQLTSLTLNSALLSVVCDQNQLASLDLSVCPDLVQLHCSWNALTSIDVSAHNDLNQLSCRDNELTSLNIANGNNHNMTYFWADLNPNLTCIQCDDAYWCSTHLIGVDAQTDFSLDCGSSIGCTVTIPDPNFKSYLVGNANINTNSDSEIQCDEATSFAGAILCTNLGITDLTGIEAFTSATTLNCFMNNLTSLDLTHNAALLILNCRYNQLTSLNLSNNLSLLDVNCSHNQITALDLSTQTALTEIDCSENLLTSLNVANGNNANIINIHFMAQQNPFLTCIQVDDAAFSTSNWLNHDPGASFSEDCGLGMNDVASMVLNLYPNPVNTILNVELKSAGTIEITTMLGEIIQTKEVQQGINSIDVSVLTSGIYFIQTQNGIKTKFAKK